MPSVVLGRSVLEYIDEDTVLLEVARNNLTGDYTQRGGGINCLSSLRHSVMV
jgi:hypothetical protein